MSLNANETTLSDPIQSPLEIKFDDQSPSGDYVVNTGNVGAVEQIKLYPKSGHKLIIRHAGDFKNPVLFIEGDAHSAGDVVSVRYEGSGTLSGPTSIPMNNAPVYDLTYASEHNHFTGTKK